MRTSARSISSSTAATCSASKGWIRLAAEWGPIPPRRLSDDLRGGLRRGACRSTGHSSRVFAPVLGFRQAPSSVNQHYVTVILAEKREELRKSALKPLKSLARVNLCAGRMGLGLLAGYQSLHDRARRGEIDLSGLNPFACKPEMR